MGYIRSSHSRFDNIIIITTTTTTTMVMIMMMMMMMIAGKGRDVFKSSL